MSDSHDPANDKPRYDQLHECWLEPGPSVSTRNISRKSRGSARLVIVGGADLREIHCESALEADVVVTFLTSNKVADVKEQPEAVTYIDEDGRTRTHTFDFLVFMKDGRKIAVAVRAEARSARLEARMELIIRYAGRFADAYLIVTEASLTSFGVYDAWLILAVRRDPQPEHDDAMRAIVADLHGQIPVEDLVAISGLGANGFRAIVRLIDAGELMLAEPSRIDYGALIQRVGALETEMAA